MTGAGPANRRRDARVMSTPIVESDLVTSIVEQHRGRPAALLTVLQDLQEELHWLPRGTLEAVSRELGVPLTQVYRVATFYTASRIVAMSFCEPRSW